ncbi:MAG: HAD-IA family hydrolase, partial [Acholeplasmatales bacterium]|nr:HAD-IA family hydrolase [Acholeplasmatales bacterium]
ECNKAYVEFLKYEAQLFDDCLDVIKYLYNKYDLYIASNGMGDVQQKRIELAGIDKFFIKSYISQNVGFNKPDLGFFEYVFKDLNDDNKDNYVIIGDRIDSDILGGINSNIHTIFVNRNIIKSDIKAEYEIISLDEIKNIL